jgi:hypothetical protein
MTAETESNQPNEEGFAGDPTTPQPEPTPADDVDGERIAVPAGDLTGSLMEALEGFSSNEDDDENTGGS